MKNFFRPIVLLAAIALTAGCGSTGAGAWDSRPADVLTTAEIEASSASTVYELIEVSRPEWLRQRGPMTLRAAPNEDGAGFSDDEEIVVYLDHTRFGGVQELHNLSTTGITSLRFLDAAEATQRWGTGHTHGAIVISTAASVSRN